MALWIRLDKETKWVQIEQGSVTNVSISDLPFMEAKVWQKLKIQNEWVICTLKVWMKMRKLLNLSVSLSRAPKTASISDFLPAKLDSGFIRWVGKGLTTINQLFEGTTLSHNFIPNMVLYLMNCLDIFKFDSI